MKKINKEAYKTSKWAGGETTEVLIFPDCASYKDRDFLFRISFAACRLPHSDFTSLPYYNRVLSVIKGGVTLHMEDRKEDIELKPYSFLYFDGNEKVSSDGSCTDFNIMTRKGKCTGEAEILEVKGDKTLTIEDDRVAVIFLTEGRTEALCNKEREELMPMEALLISSDDGEIRLKGEGRGFIAYIKF